MSQLLSQAFLLFLFFFYPSPYQPVYFSAPTCCSALLRHLFLILCYSLLYVYIPLSPCAHVFSHSHVVYSQICISSSLPCMFYASAYHSGRISQMYSICGMSFSIPFPIRGVMGIQLQDPAYVLCSSFIFSYVKSF